MTLFEHYLKTIQCARSHEVLDAIQGPLRREWRRFSEIEKKRLFEVGRAQREKLNQKPPAEEKDPFENPEQALFEELRAAYQKAQSQEEVRVIRGKIDDLVRVGRLSGWQSKELFLEDLSALRRLWLTTPIKVSDITQCYLDKLSACTTRAAFDALLLEVLPYSLELERHDKSEWWVLEHAFELKSDELKRSSNLATNSLVPRLRSGMPHSTGQSRAQPDLCFDHEILLGYPQLDKEGSRRVE